MLDAPFEGESPSSNVAPLPMPDTGPAGPDRLPRAALIYVLSVFVAGLASIAIFAPRLDTHDILGFVVIGLLSITLGRTRIPIYGDTTISIGVVGDFAIAFLFGPAGAALISPFAAMATDLGGGAWYKRIFNVGLVVVVNVLVALMIRALLDLQGPGLPVNAWLLPIAFAAVVVSYVLNISLVTVAVGLSTRSPIVEVFREKFEWLLPHFVIFGMLGLALAVAYDGLGFAGLLAFIAPPLMMRGARWRRMPTSSVASRNPSRAWASRAERRGDRGA